MSTARPMPTYRRVAAYIAQNGRHTLTPRQARQTNRMAKRAAKRRSPSDAGRPPGD